MAAEVVEDVTKDMGGRGLVWATFGNCSCNDDEKIEDGAE